MRYLTLALVVCALACSPANHPSGYWDVTYTEHAQAQHVNTLVVPVWIDAKFDDTLTRAIGQAVGDWNTALNGHMRLSIEAATPDVMAKHIAAESLVLIVRCVGLEDAPENGVLGWFDPSQEQFVNIVQGQVNVPEVGMRAVIAHEIGHWFGLEHVRSPGTLMYPGWNMQSPCVDVISATTLAASHGWDPNTMNWCTP